MESAANNLAEQPTLIPPASGDRRVLLSSVTLALGIVLASSYGLLAPQPYRGISAATAAGAQVQDLCSIVVAVLLLALAIRPSRRAYAVRLGLFGYVAYSYAIYLIGLPMNRVFLVYVVLTAVAGAALFDGLARLDPLAWPQSRHRGLSRGTGWFFIAISVLFTVLWLSALLPFAFGGAPPETQGPGGVAYPVYVLDLSIVLPCVAAVGFLLLRDEPVGGPLAIVVLTKIITLFVALWAGVVVAFAAGHNPHLGADSAPSLIMLVASCWLLVKWLGEYSGGQAPARRRIWSTVANTSASAVHRVSVEQ